MRCKSSVLAKLQVVSARVIYYSTRISGTGDSDKIGGVWMSETYPGISVGVASSSLDEGHPVGKTSRSCQLWNDRRAKGYLRNIGVIPIHGVFLERAQAVPAQGFGGAKAAHHLCPSASCGCSWSSVQGHLMLWGGWRLVDVIILVLLGGDLLVGRSFYSLARPSGGGDITSRRCRQGWCALGKCLLSLLLGRRRKLVFILWLLLLLWWLLLLRWWLLLLILRLLRHIRSRGVFSAGTCAAGAGILWLRSRLRCRRRS
jgi:hypothetical protein